jgi:cytochrome b
MNTDQRSPSYIGTAGSLRRVRVWDLPTRLFHWLLVVAVLGCVITGNIKGNAMIWHMRFGLLVLALLSFRVIWGLVGGYWSRFSTFIYGPASVFAYLRGVPRSVLHTVGHNPLGAFSVFALLAILGIQVTTGLMADDEIAFSGPLATKVSAATATLMTGWHKTWGKFIILALVLLHIGAIVFYKLVKKESLVAPMVKGDKELPFDCPPSQDAMAQRAVAAVIFAACLGMVWWVSRIGM